MNTLSSVSNKSGAVQRCHALSDRWRLVALPHMSRETVPAQPVDATPSAINLFTKGGVYDATGTAKAFRGAEDRYVEPLEGRTVLA
jgi:hypothetical protein